MPAGYAVLTAAGSGSRLGADVPKALVELRGKTLLARALEGLAASGVVDAICVTCPVGDLSTFQQQVDSATVDVPVVVVEGGLSRQRSVYLGLQGLREFARELTDSSVVLVHDAARSLSSPEFIRRVAESVSAAVPAVIPGLRVTDTIKIVDGTNPELAPIVATPDRGSLRSIQTPQAFRWDVLWRAHQEALYLGDSEATAATDDAALVERLGVQVAVCPGEDRAFKITTADDLLAAEGWLEKLDC